MHEKKGRSWDTTPLLRSRDWNPTAFCCWEFPLEFSGAPRICRAAINSPEDERWDDVPRAPEPRIRESWVRSKGAGRQCSKGAPNENIRSCLSKQSLARGKTTTCWNTGSSRFCLSSHMCSCGVSIRVLNPCWQLYKKNIRCSSDNCRNWLPPHLPVRQIGQKLWRLGKDIRLHLLHFGEMSRVNDSSLYKLLQNNKQFLWWQL